MWRAFERMRVESESNELRPLGMRAPRNIAPVEVEEKESRLLYKNCYNRMKKHLLLIAFIALFKCYIAVSISF